MTRSSQPPAGPPSPSARPSSPSWWAGSAARTGAGVRPASRRAPAEWSSCPWVSRICAIRRPDAAARSTTRRRCPSSSGPGSTTRAAVDSGAAISQVLVPSSVIGDGFGASTQVARAEPEPSIPAPGPSVVIATLREAQPGLVAVQADDRPPWGDGPVRAQDGGNVGVGGQLAQGDPGRREHAQLPGLGGREGGARTQPGGPVRLPRASRGLLARGHGGHEEAGGAATLLGLGGDPAGPGPEQVAAQHQVPPDEQLSQGDRSVRQGLLVRLPAGRGVHV